MLVGILYVESKTYNKVKSYANTKWEMFEQ